MSPPVFPRAPGWYFTVGSMRSGDLTSKPPAYATQARLE